MKARDFVSNKVSTCLYLDRKIMQTAKEAGRNVSKVAENALVEAIGKLAGTKRETAFRNRSNENLWGRGRDLNPGARLHRPMGYQATSPRPLFCCSRPLCLVCVLWVMKLSSLCLKSFSSCLLTAKPHEFSMLVWLGKQSIPPTPS
jgi:post-segregation antitoxin (ccd killing protein)